MVLGIPRSGTSWVHRVLSAAPGVRLIHEPDNETERPWPLAKSGLGRFPLLGPADGVRRYESLWLEAFSGRLPHRRVQWAQRAQWRWLSFEVAQAACDP